MGGLRRPSAAEESHTASERRLPGLVLRGHVEDERAPGVADDAPGWVEGGRDQARAGLVTVEEAEHRVRGPGVELADPAAEAGARDEAAPALADERRARGQCSRGHPAGGTRRRNYSMSSSIRAKAAAAGGGSTAGPRRAAAQGFCRGLGKWGRVRA
jgi:hypothetical protein